MFLCFLEMNQSDIIVFTHYHTLAWCTLRDVIWQQNYRPNLFQRFLARHQVSQCRIPSGKVSMFCAVEILKSGMFFIWGLSNSQCGSKSVERCLSEEEKQGQFRNTGGDSIGHDPNNTQCELEKAWLRSGLIAPFQNFRHCSSPVSAVLLLSLLVTLDQLIRACAGPTICPLHCSPPAFDLKL